MTVIEHEDGWTGRGLAVRSPNTPFARVVSCAGQCGASPAVELVDTGDARRRVLACRDCARETVAARRAPTAERVDQADDDQDSEVKRRNVGMALWLIEMKAQSDREDTGPRRFDTQGEAER